MRNDLNQFVLLDSILHGITQVKPQLIRTIHRNQRRHGCETTVALGELKALPYFSEKHTIGQIDQLGREVTNHLLGWGRLFTHAYYSFQIRSLEQPVSRDGDAHPPALPLLSLSVVAQRPTNF